MPTRLFVGEATGAKLYKMGRVGWDTGTQDTGAVYTGTLKTEKISPAGEDGLCYFRRVVIRIWRTGSYTCTMKAYVDGAQTTIPSTGATQSVTFVKSAPTSSPDESIIEMDVTGHGTYIEIELTVDSDDITGIWLPETIEVHYRPIRTAKGRSGAEVS